jgi:hypothetical protein
MIFTVFDLRVVRTQSADEESVYRKPMMATGRCFLTHFNELLEMAFETPLSYSVCGLALQSTPTTTGRRLGISNG